MSRDVAARIVAVRALLRAAAAVYADRARLVPEVAADTGLTPEGVELGFSCLEREADDVQLGALVAAAVEAPAVRVILSANVFVAPLRAIALARAASDRVTIRPSPRDPTLARALIEACADPAIALADDRDAATVTAGEIHVYGRDETVAAVRAAARSGVRVVGHGAGLGVAFVSAAARLEDAAEAIASDVVPFDQRGCLSPRLVLVDGPQARAQALAAALHERLDRWGARVPRGLVSREEQEEAVRWREALLFAGRTWSGSSHTVGLAPAGAPLALPPPGRHVHVAAVDGPGGARDALAPLARFVVTVGTDGPALGPPVAHARPAALGRMQRPPLDGPVDRRQSVVDAPSASTRREPRTTP
jgi:hypothetical protein